MHLGRGAKTCLMVSAHVVSYCVLCLGLLMLVLDVLDVLDAEYLMLCVFEHLVL